MKSILSALATSLLLSFAGSASANTPAPITGSECKHAADRTACEIKAIKEACKNVTPAAKFKACETEKRRALKTQ